MDISTGDNTGKYYVDIYNDIHATLEDAELLGLKCTITCDSFFVGSLEDQKKHVLSEYHINNNS